MDAPVTQLITKPDQTTALRVRRAQIKVIKGPDKGREAQLGHHGLIVGTDEGCDLSLSDASVSRRQLEIAPDEHGFLLRDLESKNGTWIRDLRINEVTLTSREEIQVGQTRLRFSIRDDHEELPLSTRTSMGILQGRSVAMRQVFAVLERVAMEPTTILLEGESGTGKDLAAETVHQFSQREGPYVVVDCGAMQSSLVESELFGHRKGAFTGANEDRAGAFEAANGGTVFIDEIGELDPGIQPRLLRVIERREVKRLGENEHRPVDVRLIAATNRDLSSEVEAKRFREDLFYRLSVVRVRLPPLRERREDISMLAHHLVQRLRPDLDPKAVISDHVLSLLKKYDWPGNVRELRNVVERLLLFPDRPEAALSRALVSGDSKEEEELLTLGFHDARNRCVDHFEKTYLEAMLDACDRVVAQAARKAGIPRQTFHRLMTKHRLVK